MSTRANIVIKDGYDELWLYRHSDGYPEVTLPSLNKFLEMVKSGKIRDNVSHAAGWLIVVGYEEYADSRARYPGIRDWQVGAYELTTGQHLSLIHI